MFLDIVEKNDELKQKLNEKDLVFIKELIEGVDTADPQVQMPILSNAISDNVQ